MKSLKEFRPLLKLVKEDLNKLIFASIIIFISGICEVFTGYLNGKVVEEITMLDIKNNIDTIPTISNPIIQELINT